MGSLTHLAGAGTLSASSRTPRHNVMVLLSVSPRQVLGVEREHGLLVDHPHPHPARLPGRGAPASPTPARRTAARPLAPGRGADPSRAQEGGVGPQGMMLIAHGLGFLQQLADLQWGGGRL